MLDIDFLPAFDLYDIARQTLASASELNLGSVHKMVCSSFLNWTSSNVSPVFITICDWSNYHVITAWCEKLQLHVHTGERKFSSSDLKMDVQNS